MRRHFGLCSVKGLLLLQRKAGMGSLLVEFLSCSVPVEFVTLVQGLGAIWVRGSNFLPGSGML